VLVEELPITETEICAIDSSAFPTIRVSMKVLRDSVRQEDFADKLVLTENGIPVKIDRVDCSERSSVVSVAMVFDRSGSMSEAFGSSTRISYTRSAGKKFIDKLSSADEAAIYSFSLGTTLDQNWTSDKSLLKGAIDRIQPDGWTAMNDAVIRAVDDISLRPAGRRKAIVVLSDGEDNKSAVRSIRTVIERARRADIPVFAIGLLLDTDDSLRLLASETGGKYFSVRDPAAMDSVFSSIAAAIFEKGCCSVYYTSPDARRNGTFREVRPGFTYDGDTLVPGTIGYRAPGVSGVDDHDAPAYIGGVEMESFAPNPMHDAGMLRFRLAHGGHAVIELIDITGRVVGALFDGDLSVGEHEQEVSGAGLPSGRYFLRLTTAGETALYPVQLVR
jgi:VWFA-related protein